MELQKKTRIKSNSNNDKKYSNRDNNDDQDLIDESIQTESGNSYDEGDLEYFTE